MANKRTSFEPNLVKVDKVENILGATKQEVERWVKQGKIEVHSTKPFR